MTRETCRDVSAAVGVAVLAALTVYLLGSLADWVAAAQAVTVMAPVIWRGRRLTDEQAEDLAEDLAHHPDPDEWVDQLDRYEREMWAHD